ncbi:DUF5806 family protein [Salinigranum salinum]|uniref:DUF5806 family protein n=1 Tax=Salinigranum salinum TaxID=1364937 RepID=UPI00126103D2|nr:DUF5806 family protein [Salinigranum salinum]
MSDDPAATNGEERETAADGLTERDEAAEGTRQADTATPRSGDAEGADGAEREVVSDVEAVESTATGGDAIDGEANDRDATDGEASDRDTADGEANDRDATDGDASVDETDSETHDEDAAGSREPTDTDRPPEDVRKYERFKKVDGAQYDRVNDFLRERTYITAREWAIARLCADFRTETGVEMTKIGDNLPELVPFMTDTYSPQAVNQARHAFRDKVRKSGATFLYGAMCGFFTAEELDELMYEVSEIAKFLLEVEGVDLAVAEELGAEERISSVMREVREASSELRAEDLSQASDD